MWMVGAAVLTSCSKDDNDPSVHPDKLVSPALEFANVASNNPFTGALEVTPCQANGSIYFGNYTMNGQLTPRYAFYTIGQGEIAVDVAPVRLPVGKYNFVYWGVPVNNPADSTYSPVMVNEPSFVIGTDMSLQSYGLRKYSSPDTTYSPVYDYVHAVQSLHVGTDKMAATLQRVTAGLKVTLTGKNGNPIDGSVKGIRVLVGGIASELNFFTGDPSDMTKTVSFPLTKSADNKVMGTYSTVMLFPSVPNPQVTLVVTLNNGDEKIYRQNLTNTLSAGRRLTLNATIGEIFIEESSTNGFEVTNWTEGTESIDFEGN